jgi:sulfur carrier protein ThiS
MLITFKLYASLTEFLPVDRRNGNAMPLEVPAGATVADIVARFSLPMKLVHLVLINGVYVPPEERAARALAEGETLAIWPPIAGG